MGPPILLDKSGIQSLPQKLLFSLSRYYLLVIPPILVAEILGDLLKTRQGGVEWMRMLSDKIGTSNPFVNMDHRELRLKSLLGKEVVMDGRPVVEAQEFETSFGKSAIISDTKEHSQLLRWRFEKPSALDEQSAQEWRQTIAAIDLEKLKAHLKSSSPELPRVKSISELGAVIDALLEIGDQKILLEMCFEDAHIDEDLRKKIRERWDQAKARKLSSFAPYAFFCFRIRMLFHVGLVSDLISTKSSNTADLVYFYYAPFCNIFSSNDKLHELLAPLVLRRDQYFIRTALLRSDFEAIEYFWEHLSTEQKRMWFDRFGNWPPRNTGSFTYEMWTRKMIMPGVSRRNILKNVSSDSKNKMNDHVRKVMQQFKEVQEQFKNQSQ